MESHSFPTARTHRPITLPPSLQKVTPAFQFGIQNVPEATLVLGGLDAFGPQLGLSPEQITSLGPALKTAYHDMAKSPAFNGLPSALPFTFSEKAPAQGHYFLVRPANITTNTRCIVFLHGWGGNFHWYPHALRKTFPEALILFPSWGISWVGGPPRYLTDMLAHAERKLGSRLSKPWLIGISAGGRGGFPIYHHLHDHFQGFICLANAPTSADAERLRPDLKILMINGTKDKMMSEPTARRQAMLVQKQVRAFRYQTIKGDHFFLLTQPTATTAAIKRFMTVVESMK